MGAIELLNSGDKWTDVTTRVALPLVLSRAVNGTTITYGGLNNEVHARGEPLVMALTYRYVAGKVGDVCEALIEDLGYEVPPLNAIIVNENSGLPSYGVDDYLARYFGMTPQKVKKLTEAERDAYAREAMEKVFNFTRWPQIGRYLGFSKTSSTSIDRNRGKPIQTPNPKGFAGGPESVAHKRLKQWLATQPDAVSSFGKFKEGKIEYCLASGDRLDVLFVNAKTRLAAEVKTNEASEDELQRGVYQCVKYRATLRAMQLASAESPNAQSVLVMNCRPPPIVRRLADTLSVAILDVSAEFNDARQTEG